MPDSIQLGPILIYGTTLAYVLSAVAAYIVISLRLRKDKHAKHPIKEYFINALVIVVLFWKFGTIITHPALIIESPMLLIVMSGSIIEALLGIGAAIVYFVYKIAKSKIQWRFAMDTAAYALLTYVAFIKLLIPEYGAPTTVFWGISPKDVAQSYHPLGIYAFIFLMGLLVWLWRGSGTLGTGAATSNLLKYGGAIYLLITLFKPQQNVLLFLSGEQWLAIAVLLIGYIGTNSGIINVQKGSDDH